jgi:hypothetical protein
VYEGEEMNSDKHDDHDVRSKAREVARAIKDLGLAVGKTMDRYLAKEAPRAVALVDKSLDKTAKGFETTLTRIDKRTAKQQMELLTSYRNFHEQQLELVDRKLSALRAQNKRELVNPQAN